MITKNVEEAVLSIFSTKLGKWGYKETKVMCVCVCVCVNSVTLVLYKIITGFHRQRALAKC